MSCEHTVGVWCIESSFIYLFALCCGGQETCHLESTDIKIHDHCIKFLYCWGKNMAATVKTVTFAFCEEPSGNVFFVNA